MANGRDVTRSGVGGEGFSMYGRFVWQCLSFGRVDRDGRDKGTGGDMSVNDSVDDMYISRPH